MEKNSRYFIVGLFVTISFLMLTVFIIWLAGSKDTRKYEEYTIHFVDPVSGLRNGAIVQYRGVDVGRVRDVRLSSARNDLIRVDIDVDENTPIFQSTRASLAQQGFTGIVYIELSTDEGDQTPPDRVEGERYPVIVGRGTQLSKLFQDVPQISKQILELSTKLNTAFDEETVASLSTTFKNLEAMSRDMNGLLNEQNINNASVTLQNAAQASEGIDKMIERFNRTADEMDQAVSTLNGILNENRGDINRFTRTGLKEITEMSRETKSMAESVRRLADKLEQEPSRLIYQPNYRGVEIQE
jgi:phospholipid/cholesterol/gamma-HCH transport system substrate-binding protein